MSRDTSYGERQRIEKLEREVIDLRNCIANLNRLAVEAQLQTPPPADWEPKGNGARAGQVLAEVVT